jgi:hypothetical protein
LYPLVWKTPLSFLARICCIVWNYLCLPFSFLKDSFAGYDILRFIFFTTENISCHSFLACHLSVKKSTVRWVGKVLCHSFLFFWSFEMLLFAFNFERLTVRSLGVDLSNVNLTAAPWPSCTWVSYPLGLGSLPEYWIFLCVFFKLISFP